MGVEFYFVVKREIEDNWKILLNKFVEEEESLTARVNEIEVRFSGLKDIELSLRLSLLRFKISLFIIEKLENVREPEERKKYHKMAKEYTLGGVNEIENLKTPELDARDKNLLSEHPLFKEAKRMLQQIILKGGGVFFEGIGKEARALRIVARAVARAIKKYSSRDDLYPPPELETYPGWFKRLINLLFPVLIRENQKPPPYGIEEGEEVIYSYERIRLPLSQAILYYKEELIPELEKRLAAEPGNERLQEEIKKLKNRVDEYKKLKFIPRSTPIVIESGFYTEWFTGYTENGEMLVTVPIPATQKSGTNLDRLMELVRADFVRQIANKNISEKLKKHYKFLKSLDSGLLGSSRTPSMKVNTRWGFGVIKREIPSLSVLEDKKEFLKLLRAVRGKRFGFVEREVFKMLSGENRLSYLKLLE